MDACGRKEGSQGDTHTATFTGGSEDQAEVKAFGPSGMRSPSLAGPPGAWALAILSALTPT